jgi:hypothetical protein
VFWLLSSHLTIIVLTINQVFVAISLSFIGSPIHPPPLGALTIKEEDYAHATKMWDDLCILHEDAKASLLATNA